MKDNKACIEVVVQYGEPFVVSLTKTFCFADNYILTGFERAPISCQNIYAHALAW
jgi:hypothetical protein